jgi:hypothetical protein
VSVDAGNQSKLGTDGKIFTPASSSYALPIATATVLGGVKQGTGVTIDAAGVLSAAAREPVIAAGTTAQYWRGDKTWQALPAAYALPVATTAVLGGVKQGTGVTIAADGTLAATATGTVTSVDAVAQVSGNVPLNAVKGSNAGTATNAITLWVGTAAQYSAIATKSPTTVYVVTGATVLLQAALKDAVEEATGVATGEGVA